MLAPAHALPPPLLASLMGSETSEWRGALQQPSRARPGPQPPELEEYGPNVMLVSNIRKDGQHIGSLPDGEMMFHSDTAFFEHTDKATP